MGKSEEHKVYIEGVVDSVVVQIKPAKANDWFQAGICFTGGAALVIALGQILAWLVVQAVNLAKGWW